MASPLMTLEPTVETDNIPRLKHCALLILDAPPIGGAPVQVTTKSLLQPKSHFEDHTWNQRKALNCTVHLQLGGCIFYSL